MAVENKGMETINLTGAAFFVQIENRDVDDYSFRGPIKSVKTVADILGQSGWRVRATVLRLDGDLDLDILITERAWGGTEAPFVGQDIEGTLWLQGYLWYAESWLRS